MNAEAANLLKKQSAWENAFPPSGGRALGLFILQALFPAGTSAGGGSKNELRELKKNNKN